MNSSGPKDKLLHSVWVALVAKRRSLRHRGDFEIQVGADEGGEWLRALFKRASGPAVMIELVDSGHANVYLQSARRADRNKVLYRREGLRVVRNASRIHEAILRSIELADYSEASYSPLDATWAKCTMSMCKHV